MLRWLLLVLAVTSARCAFAGLANYRTASSPVVVCTATLNPPDKEAAEKNRPDIPRAVLKTRVPPKTVGVVKPTDNAVTEINSLADWNEKIGSGTAPVVVKFYQDGCRACRAMKPRFDKLAVELGDSANFHEVNLQRAREIFDAERVVLAPSVHIFYGGETGTAVGRVSGIGLSGAKVVSSVRAALKPMLEPAALARLEELSPAALLPPRRFAATVEALRAVAQASSLLEDGGAAAEAALRMSDARRAEVRDLFAWLDRAQRGALGVDELAFWTRTLAADEEVPQGCVAPARLGNAGLAFARVELEEAVAAAAAGGQQADSELDAFFDEDISLESFECLMAAHDTEQRKTPKSAVAAAFAALASPTTGRYVPESMPTAEAAAQLAAFWRALPAGADEDAGELLASLEGAMAALDFEQRGVATSELWGRLVVRYPITRLNCE